MRTMGLVFVLVATAGLSACASAPSQPAANQDTTGSMSNLERYHKAVHLNAERKNVRVQWVNPPKEEDLDEYTDEDDEK